MKVAIAVIIGLVGWICIWSQIHVERWSSGFWIAILGGVMINLAGGIMMQHNECRIAARTARLRPLGETPRA